MSKEIGTRIDRRPMWAVGCMSGTSMDGVDAAELLTDGETILEFGRSAYRPFTESEGKILHKAMGNWRGPDVEACANIVEQAHIELLSDFRRAELIGFHGQTLAHDPAMRRSLQAGDGQVVADALEIPVVWDFRSADLRNRGQGAPLVPFYHFALAAREQIGKPIALLNIGGVSNLTLVDARYPAPEMEGALIAFDVGPGNAVIDDVVRGREGKRFDCNGEMARRGCSSNPVVELFMRDPYFAQPPPKSLDRGHFARLVRQVDKLETNDAVATVTKCVSSAILAAVQSLPKQPAQVIVCGGGRLNETLLNHLRVDSKCPVSKVDAWGYDGDMLEAQAFAFLAVRSRYGLALSGPGTTGCRYPTKGGRISYPRQLTSARQRRQR